MIKKKLKKFLAMSQTKNTLSVNAQSYLSFQVHITY